MLHEIRVVGNFFHALILVGRLDNGCPSGIIFSVRWIALLASAVEIRPF